MFSYKRGNKRIIAALMVLMMGSVAGCGASSAESSEEIVEEIAVSEVSYTAESVEVPEQIPNIMVDQSGFNIDSEKVVIFRGRQLPESFQIIDLESGEVVYTGEVVKANRDEETEKYYGIGRFNDFREPGNYYISADYIGESYAFTIGEDVYRDVFDEACRKYYSNRCGIAISQVDNGDNGHSACHTTEARFQENSDQTIDVTGGWHMDENADRDVLIGCRILENLLLSFEMNPNAFTDETGIPESGNGIPDIIDEIKYEADWLLKMQDSKTGGVYGAAITGGGGSDIFSAPVEVTPVSMEATISFAAAMARLSFIYQQYDQDYATAALRAADRAWESFSINQSVYDSTQAFKAAAELYRATGSDKYHHVLDSFFVRDDLVQLFNDDENIFIGAVTYLSTNQNVDKEQCEKLIKALMKKSEAIAQRATESRYLVANAAEGEDFSTLLDEARCLTITNHIIYNHEYTTIIENHAHYMMGMNPSCLNFVTSSTERDYKDTEGYSGVMNDPQKDALLIFMLSVLEN
ncbi:glycoside hydrolase family 9 protein [Butyrivibrio sp. VCB2006]|uniref:glycoside hydrolase family 9 protein n=1 Tax=Butyrivibrio sp. VCB2006 TaxID=1280679 RepID=UPI000492616A|nr:glycoside hydrolase family 9 protein [Butyrivibrio sp. VCB2006]